MTDPTIAQTVLFRDLFDKPLVATFGREQASSDGGAVLLKAAERVYGLVKALGRCLVDRRGWGLTDLDNQCIYSSLQRYNPCLPHITSHLIRTAYEISEAIRFHVESLREHHEPVPKPRCTATVVDVVAVARRLETADYLYATVGRVIEIANEIDNEYASPHSVISATPSSTRE